VSDMKNKVYRLDELCDIKSGKRIPKEMDFVTSETEHPYIRARDIKEGKINTDDLIYLEDDVFQKIKRYIINSGDIAITIVGASVGDTGYASKDIDGYNLTENAVRLTNYKNNVDSKFLHYVLAQKQYHDYMQLIAGAAAQPKLGIYKVKRIKVELPDLKKQKRIADILSTNDNLIENNNKRIKLLEQMAENLYKEWFVRFRFPGYEGVTLENGLPKEWEYTKLERLANISTGKCNREDAEEDGAYPLFDRSQEIKRSNVWLKDCEAIIVPGEGTSFIPRYYNGKFNLHQRCYCVEPLEKGMGFFLYQTLMMYRIYFLYVATGATVPSLRLNNFNDFKVLLPKKELCFQYNEIAEKMNDEILLLKNKNELLSKQRDMLLPRLMSGKLEV